jgi:prolyl oligopeptidase PreP (S9A serine peptidase family)
MNELGGYAFVDLRVGMCATFAKTVTEADIVLMAHAARIARDLLSAGEENTCVYRKLKLGHSGGEVRQGWHVI